MLDTQSGKAPQGTYKVRVSEVPKKGHYEAGNTPFYAFKFDLKAVDDPGVSTTHTERFVVFMMGPLAQALGFPEVPPGSGKHPDFEPDKCYGKVFYADIIHERQAKGKSAGKIFARLVNPRKNYSVEVPEEKGEAESGEPFDDQF